MAEQNHQKIIETIGDLSSEIDITSKDISVILAGGHGKRIKSETPKMLHKIWGVPTVFRVVNTVTEGLGNDNKIIVVGIKGDEVAHEIGKRKNTAFVYQKEQRGTGHAIQVAFESFKGKQFNGNIYIFPGDMGLVTTEAVRKFKEEFEHSNFDMMVLTGIYDGRPEDNYYGRVIRMLGKEATGQESGEKIGRVMEIKEHKDILSLRSDYSLDFDGSAYKFTRDELLNIREFNGGVYAFKGDKLREHIMEIDADNVQGEFYLTTLVTIFNGYGLKVGASRVPDNTVIIAFNNRAVLKDMEDIARSRIYGKLKNIITFKDKEDFFLADEVVQQILDLDRREETLDIVIGKGVHLHKGVQLNRGVHIKKNSLLEGNIKLGKNVTIWEGVTLSTYPDQTMRIGQGSEILQGDIVKGNMEIGENCRIESSVNMTGSDDCPTRIGKSVTIKGTSYIFGSVIDDDVWIEHSVIKNKRVEKVLRRDGSIQQIRYYLPQPEGIDSITGLSPKQQRRN